MSDDSGTPLGLKFCIDESVLAALKLEASKGAGLEVCGLLWADLHMVVRHHSSYPGPLFPARFECDPGWMLEEFMKWRQRGARFGGYYHSHPTGMSLSPSPQDLLGHPPHSFILLLSENGCQYRVFRKRSAVEECEECPVVVIKKREDVEIDFHGGK